MARECEEGFMDLLSPSSFQINFHGKDMTSLHKFVDPECLTARYGGSLDCAQLDGKLLFDLFNFYQKEYEEEYSYGYTK